MATENNRPFVMTCDAVDAAVEDETVHITVPFKVEKQDDEPRGDDAGEGEPTSQVTTDAAPTPPGVKHEGKLIHIVRRIRVVPEKVEDEAKDALAKDEAIAMDRKPVALSAADCKAKNPIRCPYHGAAEMSDKFAEILKKHGLGAMKFTITPFDETDDEDRTYVLDFECPEEYAETNGMEALKEFGKLEGVEINTEDMEGLIEKKEKDRREAIFCVDFFDKDAEDPKIDAGEEATEEAKEEAAPEATEKPVEAPKAEEAPKATEDTPKAPETASEPPKTEEEHKKDPKDDFEEDTKAPEKAPEDDFEEDTKKPEHEPAKPSKYIPKDPVERALKAIEDFDGMVSGARIHKIEEAKGNCDSCAKDIDFLKKAIDGAPNDRVKKMLESKLDAAAKEMDIYQSELKHACGDAMRELKDSIDDKISGKAACELKMEHGSGSEVRKEIESLQKEAGLKSITKIDGYKELNKAQKAFSEADAALTSLSEEYDEASANDDYRRMIDVADKINDQIKKCSTASDNLKLARENVKASLVKMAKEAAEKYRESLPEKFKSWGLLPHETAPEYIERMKKLGMSDDIPETIKNIQDRIEMAEAAMKRDYGYSDEQWKKIKENMKKSWDYTMSVSSLGCNMDATIINKFFASWLKSQHELGEKGTRIYDSHTHHVFTIGDENDSRYRLTRNFYGTSLGMDEKHYEKYGNLKDRTPYAGDASDGRGYGKSVIRFRTNSVVATVTGDDSLSECDSSVHRSPLVTDISPTFLFGSQMTICDQMLSGPVEWTVKDWKSQQGYSPYIELQFHGAERPRPEDVESINFGSEGEFKILNKTSREMIRKLGIKVYVNGKERAI